LKALSVKIEMNDYSVTEGCFMMHGDLLITSMLERAENLFPEKQVISRTGEKVHRLTYREIGRRTRQLASKLQKSGLQKGQKAGTLAWNHHRHLELYFALPAVGAVVHTINIRLSPEHIVYIINHAEDELLFVDADILPLVEAVYDKLTTVKSVIVMTDDALPETKIDSVYSYEEWIADGDPEFRFPEDIKETDPAGMCFTSATTGNPKGVVYTHRSTVLHSMSLSLADSAALSESDTRGGCLMHPRGWERLRCFQVRDLHLDCLQGCFRMKRSRLQPGSRPSGLPY
jgi:fatty-acyl-CoA synthase